jgi:hypothetical protein
VQQAEAIRQVQQEVAEQGLDPMANPREFGQYVSSRFQELNQPQLATRSLLQARQLESQFAPEPVETERVVSGDSEIGQQLGLGQGETAIASFTDGVPTGIKDRQMPDEQKGNAVNVRLPDGSFVRGRELEDGTVVDLQGREFPSTANVVGLDLAASKESDLPQKDVDILNSKEIGVKNYIDLANEAIGVYNQNPSANTLAAEGTRILSGIQSEFDALLDVTGVELADGTSASKILDPSTYESKFQELGLENAGLKSLYLSLALSQAQAEAEQKGRALSDKDVERFLSQQGAQYANPKFATELLRRNASRLENAFVNEYETRTGKDFDGEFDDLLEFAPPEKDASEQETEEVETVNWDDL